MKYIRKPVSTIQNVVADNNGHIFLRNRSTMSPTKQPSWNSSTMTPTKQPSSQKNDIPKRRRNLLPKQLLPLLQEIAVRNRIIVKLKINSLMMNQIVLVIVCYELVLL